METERTNGPFCFVITSFGSKPNIKDLHQRVADGKGGPVQQIQFDEIYKQLIEPAIRKAGMEPLIEHEEKAGGIIHKTMYEKIILAEFCVADLTNANPNAYYELGMRYATKPFTTIPMIASSHHPPPFDVAPNRLFTYGVDNDFKFSDLAGDLARLVVRLEESKAKRSTDSPLYDLVNGISFNNSVAHEKTDVFREKVEYDKKIKQELAYARAKSPVGNETKKEVRTAAITAVVKKYTPLENTETGVIIDMMISYRNIEAFAEMQAFIESMPRYVFETVMVQEQYAFVLNRNGGKKKPVDEVMIDKAEAVLEGVKEKEKASSETYGIWGRIYKDKFERAYDSGDKAEAKVHLKKACQIYQLGFEFDPRDAYPGVNYVTCLELLGEHAKALRLLPAVEYAALAKMKRKKPDYWDYATLLELAVIENKYDDAEEFYQEAKPIATETWMLGTTKKNLEKILNYRKERGEGTGELESLLAKFS
ncbi:MAG TPA: TRAFs-binding domain-containing protein [Bacteroidia bacterium]|nr:TRAFs-binding domain-containing protein [Bacteroidia bacterium]